MTQLVYSTDNVSVVVTRNSGAWLTMSHATSYEEFRAALAALEPYVSPDAVVSDEVTHETTVLRFGPG